MFCLGSAADLCKSAMLHIEHKLQEEQLAHDAHLLLQIHDELVWEVSNAQLTNVRGESFCLKPRQRI
jgi:DNA polymerase-1